MGLVSFVSKQRSEICDRNQIHVILLLEATNYRPFLRLMIHVLACEKSVDLSRHMSNSVLNVT
jgi:hypothetical protein